MTRDKKILSPVIRTYNNDTRKRWRVEYWEPIHNGRSKKRVVHYGNINTGATVEERYQLAFALINSLSLNSDKPKEKNILEQVLDIGAIEWRPKTLSAYKTVVTAFSTFLKKNLPETATTETINKFLVHVFAATQSAATVNKYRNILYLIYNKAIAKKMVAFNPVQKLPGKKKQATSLLYFNDAHIAAFKNAALDPQLWLAIRLLFYCFIRPGEMRSLKVADINFDYGFIEINSKFSKNKKTQKVSIPHHFLKELEYLKQYPDNFYLLSKNGVPGLVQIATNWIYNTHKKALDLLKIKGRYSFYSWKHTGVVKAVKAGLNIKDLQLQLRHHSLDMVNEYLKNLGVLDSEDLRTRFPTL